MRLDTGHRVEHGDCAIEDAQRSFDFDREVHMARGVDDVDPGVVPKRSGGGRGDGDAALLLLLHPVHDRGALVDLTHLVGLAGVEEDPLGGRRLARVDVGHDPDIPGPAQRVLAKMSKRVVVGHEGYQR